MWFGQLFLDGCIVCSDLATGATFVVLLLKLSKDRSAKGLSLQTVLAVVSARCLHMMSHLVGLHYTPSVLPWILYPSIDIINAIIGGTTLFVFCTQYFDSYEKEKDNFGIHVFQKFDLLPKRGPLQHGPVAAASFLYIVIAIAGLAWHFVRRSPHSFALSYFCCFYEVMTAVALIPQLWMFHQDKRVSPLLAQFVVCTAINRLCTLTFWASYPWIWTWRYPDNRGIQMASECLNLVILSDFLFYWIRSKIRGDAEIILSMDPIV